MVHVHLVVQMVIILIQPYVLNAIWIVWHVINQVQIVWVVTLIFNWVHLIAAYNVHKVV